MPRNIAPITPTATAMPIVELEIAPEESVGIVTGGGGGGVTDEAVSDSVLRDEAVGELSEGVVVVANSGIGVTKTVVTEEGVLEGAAIISSPEVGVTDRVVKDDTDAVLEDDSVDVLSDGVLD